MLGPRKPPDPCGRACFEARYLGDDLLHRLPARSVSRSRRLFPLDVRRIDLQPGATAGRRLRLQERRCGSAWWEPLRWREFLYGGRPARNLNDGGSVRLVRRSEHFVYSQFAQFWTRVGATGCRSSPPCPRCWSLGQAGGLEALFEQADAQGYIEGARAGRGICRCRLVVALQPAMPSRASAPMAASALQLGLLRNLHEAEALVRRWAAWFCALRDRAIALALDDAQVRCLCQQVVAVAEGGLAGDEQQWLDYVRYVVETGETAADRMLRL